MSDKNVFIRETATISQTLKQIDETGKKALLVVDQNNYLLGTISDGDIRRSILRGCSLDSNISGVFNKTPHFILSSDYSLEKARETILKTFISLLPIVDGDRKVVDYVDWEQVVEHGEMPLSKHGTIDIPVVVMAGGKGKRLLPFTEVLPKPLVPVGNRTIIEMILDQFGKFGVNRYFLTLNYRGEMIEAYFKCIEKRYNITFLWEKDFFGTAGSLKLIEGNDKIDSFIVSNCDILVKADYSEVYHFHRTNNASLTVVSSIQHHTIPYGVIDFKNGGEITEITEKPQLNFTINTGVYILDKECLSYIPKDTHMDMTTLIEVLMQHNKKVFTYPVKESDYVDIGEWDEYRKAIEKMELFK